MCSTDCMCHQGVVSLALLIQIVTGHSYFRAHMWYTYRSYPEDVIDIDCQICGNEPETPWHIYNCPLIFFQRHGESDGTDFNPKKILQYFCSSIIPSIMGNNKLVLDKLINKYRKTLYSKALPKDK